MSSKIYNTLNQVLPRPVSFVFSGGTSLGAVQAGMLKAVLEYGLQPDLLLGTSVGAVNAASVGQGFSASGVENLARIWSGLKTSDVFGRPGLKSVMTLLSGRGGLASPEGLRSIVREHLPGSHAGLAIRTAVVATDLLSGHPVILSEGDLRLNVMASSAIPMIFPEVKVDNRPLVDGGVVGHVPLLQAEIMGARTLVVFDAGYPCKLSRLPTSPLERALHLINLMLRGQSLGLLQLLDRRITTIYLPAPCPLEVPVYDFSQGQWLIEAGFESGRGFLADLSVEGPGIYGHPHVHDGQMVGSVNLSDDQSGLQLLG